MARDEKQTRAELIDPALYARGWTEELIRRERTPGGVDIVDGKPRKRKGRTDYLLCVPVSKGKPTSSGLPTRIVSGRRTH